MAKIVYGLSQSLDGYVDHLAMPPSLTVFRHFKEQERNRTGSLYGRRTYEILRYWDDDHPDWDDERREFAAIWRRQPKWVASRSPTPVGPNATLMDGDLGAFVRKLKSALDGEIAVAGPDLAQSLTELGLIDEYRLYFRPFVLGSGTPYFAGPRPPLRMISSDRIGDDLMRLTYVPA